MIRKHTLDISHSIFMMKYGIFFIALWFFFFFFFGALTSLLFRYIRFLLFCWCCCFFSFESSFQFVTILIISANISFYLLPFSRPLSFSFFLSASVYLLSTLPFTFQFPINVDYFFFSFVCSFIFLLLLLNRNVDSRHHLI